MYIYSQEEHHTFLLHVWKDTPDGERCFILKDVNTQDQLSFNNLEELMVYLHARFAERAEITEIEW